MGSARDVADQKLKQFTPTGKPRCKYPDVPGQGGWHNHQCYSGGKYKSKDGKVYCKTHLPENVKARRDAKQAKWNKEWDASSAHWSRERAMTNFCEGLSNEQMRDLPSAKVLADAWLEAGGVYPFKGDSDGDE